MYKPYFNTIPETINCDEKKLEDVKKLLSIMPRDLLSEDTIKAIENGDPIDIVYVKTDAAFRNAQDPQVQLCYKGKYLQYIVRKEQADEEKAERERERWQKRYRDRCPIGGRPCSLRNSCCDCPHRDKKDAFILSIEMMLDNGMDPGDVVIKNGNRSKFLTYHDPTAESFMDRTEFKELLSFLSKAGERLVREYVLDQTGYSHKAIARMLKRSEASVSRDFKMIDVLLYDFYNKWND